MTNISRLMVSMMITMLMLVVCVTRASADDTMSAQDMELASQLFEEAYGCPIPEAKSSVSRVLKFDLGDFIHIRNSITSNSGTFDEEVTFALRNVDEVTSRPDNSLLFTCRPGETCVSQSSGTSCAIGQKCKLSGKRQKGGNHYGKISAETSLVMRFCDAETMENALFAIRPIMRHIRALQRDPASLDCYDKFASSASKVELAICSSRTLRRLDKQMSETVERAKRTGTQLEHERLTTNQERWFASLSNCLANDTEKCLVRLYQDRMTKVILGKY